jgi:2-polyprenyl-3-methyl-5-hydroxy-6-metoxy-1,4-benzoquinol methylase
MRQNKKCPACQVENFKIFVKMDECKKISFKEYDRKYYEGFLTKISSDIDMKLLKCNNCKHIFWYEIPSKKKISLMYEEHARIKLKKKSKFTNSYNDEFKKKTIHEMIKIFPQGKTFCDYGAGACEWAEFASKYFKVTAYDKYLSRMNDNNNFEIQNRPDTLINKKFDFIFINQVFEHIDFHNESLSLISKICHKNSIVYINVPNVGRENMTKLANEWPYNGKESHLIAPFQHLHGFTQKSLNILMNKNGFKELSLKEQYYVSKIYFFRKLLGYIFPFFSSTRFIGRKK